MRFSFSGKLQQFIEFDQASHRLIVSQDFPALPLILLLGDQPLMECLPKPLELVLQRDTSASAGVGDFASLGLRRSTHSRSSASMARVVSLNLRAKPGPYALQKVRDGHIGSDTRLILYKLAHHSLAFEAETIYRGTTRAARGRVRRTRGGFARPARGPPRRGRRTDGRLRARARVRFQRARATPPPPIGEGGASA